MKQYHKYYIRELDEKIAIHINDTHPTLAIPELMRILLDEEGLPWEEAFRITTNTISYTNHTILAEALEKWPANMVKTLLPRIYMIIEEINERFCKELWNKYTGQWDKISRMAIISDNQVKMAHLAIVGSHSVNGVAKLHTEILKKKEMSDFYYYYPNKFNNKTNGITHRRWLIRSNPKLTKLLIDTIGDGFIEHPMDLKYFESKAYDKNIQLELNKIKKENKEILAKTIYDTKGIVVDPNSIFDVQVKRIHAYKRQTLNCLRIMDLYNKIELINAIADKVNNDPRVKDKIKVVFLDNYRVSLAEEIIRATDVSEQISTTTKEASGTSNMKFMMNGAITVATLDGANIEIRDEVSDENIIVFGLNSSEVLNYYQNGQYSSFDIYRNNNRVKAVVDRERFREIYNNLITYNDEFFVLKDFDSYIGAQDRVNELYKDINKWQQMCGINIAHSGIFSSDRTILQYATGIWGSELLYKNL